MATEWLRGYAQDQTATVTKSFRLINLPLHCTVLSGWWNVYGWLVAGGVNAWPPGTSLTQAGLTIGPTSGLTTTGPLTNPTANWIDIRTMPWVGNIAISSQVDWFLYGSTGLTDTRFKASRKSTGAADALWVQMETQVTGDADPSFSTGFSAWANASAFLDHV